MKGKFEFSLLFALLLAAACGPQKMISKDEMKWSAAEIIKGKLVRKKDDLSHHLVLLVSKIKGKGEAICTGTIYSSNVILTAAHCLDEKADKMYVVFNSSIKKAEKADVREIDEVVVHSMWGLHQKKGEGDIGMAHFKGEMPEDFEPITLDSSSSSNANDFWMGKEVVMAGYGINNSKKDSGPGVLRKTNSTILQILSPTEFVVDGEKSSACFGDSGGPLIDLESGEQIGIASSVTNGECNEACVYTAIKPYLTWITKTAKKFH